MPKTYIKTLTGVSTYISTSSNFSEMTYPDGEPFDYGDNGKAEDEMVSAVQADLLLLQVLQSMNDRQKVILMYQLLRESGFNLNHADCAKTLAITRERYMVLLKDIKKRAGKILQSEGVS